MTHNLSIPLQDSPITINSSPDSASPEKPSSTNIEDVDRLETGPRGVTNAATGAAAELSQDHREYLIARHVTVELDPIPSM